jgi:uncharacterized phage protein (TIGR01671 family)
MSRILKFRAWDTESNIMVYSDKRNKKDWDCDYFFQQDDGGNMICYWDYDYDDSFGEPTHNCGELDNLMQYTGLKDKNGMGLTEVFEGDIISEDGILKGNIYENDKRETDIVVPQLGTKDWETTYKEIVVRGYDYSE